MKLNYANTIVTSIDIPCKGYSLKSATDFLDKRDKSDDEELPNMLPGSQQTPN